MQAQIEYLVIVGFGIGLRYITEDSEETPEMRAEWDQAQELIDLLTLDMDTKEIFEDVIEARETYGIAYLEVIRNSIGQVNQIAFIRDVPSVEKTYPLNPPVISCYNYKGKKLVERPRRFCKYRQQVGGQTIYFKEFGDPRIMDNRTGDYINPEEDFLPIAYQANEILDFTIGTELYGEVRWIGQLLGVDGSRMAERLNNNYFRNGRHTPLMICVNGGTLTADSYAKLRQYMDEIRGENGQHAFLVLEVENEDSRADFDETKKPDIEVKDLASILQKDELFQDYIENSRRRLQSSFRLPDLYTGYTTDFNRATAQTAMEVTEKQVFQPERKSLAWIINNRLLNEYGFQYVEAYFQAPDMSNPDDIYKILTICEKAGGVTPNKAREIVAEAMGESAENYEGDWGDTPIAAKDLIAAQAEQQVPAASVGAGDMPDLLSQLTGQIQKAAAHRDDDIVPVLKEIRALLKQFPQKPFTNDSDSDIIKASWSEHEHPRDDDGQFADGTGSHSSKESSSDNTEHSTESNRSTTSARAESSSNTAGNSSNENAGTQSSTVSAEGANTPCTGFATPEKLTRHFRQHGQREFGMESAEEYQQKGIAFLAQPCGGDVVGYSYHSTSEGKDKIVRFNSATTEYATGFPGDKICTYYKAKYDTRRQVSRPERAMAYYLRHKEEDLHADGATETETESAGGE